MHAWSEYFSDQEERAIIFDLGVLKAPLAIAQQENLAKIL